MAYFTIDEVRRAAASATGAALDDRLISIRADAFFERQSAEARMVPVRHFDIFLSHAYKDKVIVAGIYHLLKASGFTVYVDWVHDRNRIDRSKVTADNAAILRERMRQCSALFFVTTDNYKDSRWMPWECGYFDGYDGKLISGRIQAGHVAILPVLESPTETFEGVEYLGLYPVAQKGNLTRRNINIHNQKIPSRSIHFDPWVKNGHP